MWPFKTKKDDSTLEETKRQLESRIRTIEGEWDDTYERFRLLYARLSKRVKQLADEPSSLEEPQGAGSDEAPTEGLNAGISSLSPRQAKIQREILARRNRAAIGGE